MAQYQDTIARLLLEEADEAVTRAALDVIMPVAPAVHFSYEERGCSTWLRNVVFSKKRNIWLITPCIHVERVDGRS